MMMGFGILVIAIFGVVLWQFVGRQNQANAIHKEKRKVKPKTEQDIAYKRYANDEISQEEYITLLNDLEKSNHQHQ